MKSAGYGWTSDGRWLWHICGGCSCDPPSPGPSLGREDNTGELEQDFMFALFIQKQEEAALMSGRPGEGGGAGRDPTVGHFCAPFCPGFCEANLCIFHTSG